MIRAQTATLRRSAHLEEWTLTAPQTLLRETTPALCQVKNGLQHFGKTICGIQEVGCSTFTPPPTQTNIHTHQHTGSGYFLFVINLTVSKENVEGLLTIPIMVNEITPV